MTTLLAEAVARVGGVAVRALLLTSGALRVLKSYEEGGVPDWAHAVAEATDEVIRKKRAIFVMREYGMVIGLTIAFPPLSF